MKLILQIPCYNQEHTLPDSVSRFRAYTREAATALNVVSGFSYTIETIIQALSERFDIVSVTIRTSPHTWPSRRFKSIPQFISRQLNTLNRIYAMYQPLRAFAAIVLVLTLIGLAPILPFRFFAIFMPAGSGGQLQSPSFGAVFVILGFLTFIPALLADLIGCDHKLIERALKMHRVGLSITVGLGLTDLRVSDQRVVKQKIDAWANPAPRYAQDNL